MVDALRISFEYEMHQRTR